AAQHAVGHGRAGYLGVAYDPFETFGYPTSSNFRVRNLRLPGKVDESRMAQRRSMLERFDTIRRDADATGAIAALHTFRHQAFEPCTRPDGQEAVDLNPASDATRSRAGKPGGPGQIAVLARPLVERGARWVTGKTSFGAP